jgi:hypothetical protein
MSEKKFAKGLYANKPKQGAPDFVISRMSVKVDDFIAFLNEHKNEKGYVNIDQLAGKEDKFNFVLNEFKPKLQPNNELNSTLPF